MVDKSDYLDGRKSIIYRKRPRFSIFGIGDYSFKPYKIAIAGLYKLPSFSLLLSNDKPMMLDDTCYYLSFDDFNEAFFTYLLLNTNVVREFLSSIVFLDSKRPYTKSILMRIDIRSLAKNITFDILSEVYREKLSPLLQIEFSEEDFIMFQQFTQLACLF